VYASRCRAGAVGSYYGGMLSRSGHQVMLIGRTQHIEAIRRHGWFMDTTGFRAHVQVRASTEVSDIQGASLVLCCTAQDLMRGKRSEIDHLNGYIVRRGRSLAIDAPTNQALYSIVKLLESAFTAAQA
jgi:ketopantoate reductase